MKNPFVTLLAAAGFAAAALPAAAQTNDLAAQQIQLLIQRCAAANLLPLERVQQLTNEQLFAELNACSARLQGGGAASPAAVGPAAVGPAVSAPRQAASGWSGSRYGSGYGSGGGWPGSSQSPGPTGKGSGSGGGSGTGTGTGGASTPAAPPPGPLAGIDARIAGLQGTLQKGIASGAITQGEAAGIGAQLAALQALRANSGTTQNNKLLLQQRADTLAALINNRLHNNVGVPDPNTNAFRARLAANNAAQQARQAAAVSGRPSGLTGPLQQQGRVAPGAPPRIASGPAPGRYVPGTRVVVPGSPSRIVTAPAAGPGRATGTGPAPRGIARAPARGQQVASR
jgi:hypothetical protein